MDMALWIVAGVLALLFLMAGSMKLLRTKEQLSPRMAWVEEFDPWAIKAIAAAEVAGAVGMILPPLTGILVWLAPLAAAGLALTMIGAMITHARYREYAGMVGNFVLFALAAFVAVGRFVIAPF